MKPLRRRTAEPEADGSAVIEVESEGLAGKGRPTPKRRDSNPRRGPVTAPKTRKEAMQRQKQLAKTQRTVSPASKMSPTEYRAALRRGEASVLPRKDQGPVRALARDYVDTHRMLSNFMLWLFPLLIVSYVVQFIQILVIAILLATVAEAYWTGRKIVALAVNRGLPVKQGPAGIAFYALQRAYMPRRWRLPAAKLSYGDEI